jgi:hypothetical protein
MKQQAGAAQQGQIGQHIGVAAAGCVFAQGGVAAVMVAVFDACPMGSDQVDPLLWGAFLPVLAGKIKPLLAAFFAGFFDQPSAAKFEDDTAGAEAGGQRFGSGEACLTGFYAPVSAAGLLKKGASGALIRAISSKEGWLDLIWSK